MPKFSMPNFSPSPTHIPNIIKVGHTVPKKCSGQKNMDGGRRTDTELSSGETKRGSMVQISLKFEIKLRSREW